MSLLENSSKDEDAQDLLYYRCFTDVALFARHFFAHYCKLPFNQFHNRLFESWREPARGIRHAFGAPRGYAKSTYSTLIKPIHDICYGVEDYICIFSNTKPQATGRLKNIRTELFSNAKLLDMFRIRPVNRVMAETQFVINCDGHETMLAAYGAGTEVRGVSFGEKRPTKIILDDVEHSKEVFNEEIRQKYVDWYFEVISYLGDKQTNIEFVGTVLHPKSLLVGLSKNPSYTGQIYKAVVAWSERQDLWDTWQKVYMNLDNDDRESEAQQFYDNNKADMLKGTEVFWPEHEDYLYLMKELVEKGKRSFMKEKQNSPLGAEDSVFSEFHYYREVAEGIKLERSGKVIPWDELKPSCYGAMDPSTGQTKPKKGRLGDFTCILTGYKHASGRLFVHKDWTKREAPTKYIEAIFELGEVFNYEKFGVETNLYRNLLLPNIVTERQRREKASGKVVKMAFYDIEQTDNKEKRIYTLEPKVSHGWIVFNRALSEEFMNQLEEFPHADHDDCPDTLEMLWGLVNNRYKPSPLSLNPMGTR